MHQILQTPSGEIYVTCLLCQEEVCSELEREGHIAVASWRCPHLGYRDTQGIWETNPGQVAAEKKRRGGNVRWRF